MKKVCSELYSPKNLVYIRGMEAIFIHNKPKKVPLYLCTFSEVEFFWADISQGIVEVIASEDILNYIRQKLKESNKGNFKVAV